jgi:hypothetical protein
MRPALILLALSHVLAKIGFEYETPLKLAPWPANAKKQKKGRNVLSAPEPIGGTEPATNVWHLELDYSPASES